MAEGIRIIYKEGGYTLVWFDKELGRLQVYTAGESKGKTVERIEEVKHELFHDGV